MGGFAGADRSYHWGGGIPPFSEREINMDFEAGALLNKAYADVVKDSQTLDANILKGMPYGRNQSEANKPTLEFPLMNIRQRKSGEEESGKTSKQIFNNLINLLPKNVKEKLASEQKLPESQRNPSFTALEKSLTYTSAALALLYKASSSFDGESTALRFGQQNLQFTEQALNELIRQGKELLKEGYASLKQMGPNHPHFDTLLKHLKNAASTLKMLKRVHDEERKKKHREDDEEEEDKQDKKSQKQEKEKQSIQTVLDRVQMYTKHYHESFAGDHLLMVGPLLQAINNIGRTQSLNDGLRSILLGLILFNTGNETPYSTTSPIKEGTNTVITKLMDVVGFSCLNEIEPKAKELFPMLSKTFVILCVIGALYIVTSHSHHEILGESLIEEEDEYLSESEETLVNTYTLWNLVGMFLKVNLIKGTIPEELLDPQYGVTNSLNIVTGTIEFITICIIIRAVKQIDEDASHLLLNGLAQALIERSEILEDIIDGMSPEEKSQIQLDEKQVKGISVQLTNCRIALQNEQYPQWGKHWDEVLKTFGMSSDTIEEEMDHLITQATLLRTLIKEDIQDFSNAVTGIVQI